VRRRAVLSLLILLLGLPLAGCWHTLGVDQRGLISVVGVDPGPHGLYHFTFGVLNPPGLPAPGGKGSTSGAPTTLPHSADATDIDQAVHAASAQMHLHFDLAHLQVLVVSEEVARQGLMPILDFVARSPTIIETGHLLVVRGGRAESLLEGGAALSPYEGKAIEDTEAWTEMQTPLRALRLFQVISRVPMLGNAPFTAGIRVTEPAGGKEEMFRIEGQAVFAGDKLAGWLSQDATYGLALARGHVAHLAVSFPGPTPGGAFTLDLIGARPQEAVRTIGGRPVLELTVAARGRLASLHPEVPLGRPADIVPYQTAAATRLVRFLTQAVKETKALKADAIGFGEAVRIDQPQLWRRWRPDWPGKIYPELPVVVHAKVTIIGTGDKGTPINPQTGQD